MSINERLLNVFHASEDQFVSGERLSRELHVTRTAVWKHIQELRSMGYTFDSSPRLGYRLTGSPDYWNASALLGRLQTDKLGWRLHLFESLDSTQNKAHELVRQGSPEGTLVIAEQQTAGRGRLGRSWYSPKGKGIWMSLILKPEIPVQFIPQFTLLIAVALYRAIRINAANVDIGIKWPNDLLIKGKKVCGILLESSATDESLNYVIAGVGISANLTEDDYTDELRDIATSLLIESGHPVDRTALVADWLKQVEDLYGLYMAQGFAPIRTLWEASNVTLGKNVKVHTPAGIVEGKAIGLLDSGALNILRPDGETAAVYSGTLHG